MKEPNIFTGTCSYEGHMCSPLLLSDVNRVIPGKFWTNRENANAAKEMLLAAFNAGRNATLSATAAIPSGEEARLRELVRRARNNVPEFYVEWHAAARAALEPQAGDV